MALIKYTNDLITGVEEMDKEHRKLVELFNQVYELMKEGRKQEASEKFIKELKTYVDTHLKHEEEFMESINYPEIDKHKRLHGTFRKLVYALEDKINSGDLSAFRQALAAAWGWIHVHIKTTDRKYGEYYRSIRR